MILNQKSLFELLWVRAKMMPITTIALVLSAIVIGLATIGFIKDKWKYF